MEYINHYTLLTGHMRRSYSNEINNDTRIRMRELIEFDKNVSSNYAVPFMDGTKLHITADGSFYCAEVILETKNENITLLTTIGCKNKNGLSLAMKAIENAYKDLFGKSLGVYHPELPFIVDVPTPFCTMIANWSGDFCRTLAWSIFDDTDCQTTEKKAKQIKLVEA